MTLGSYARTPQHDRGCVGVLAGSNESWRNTLEKPCTREALEQSGIRIQGGARAGAVSRDNEQIRLRLENGDEILGDRLLVGEPAVAPFPTRSELWLKYLEAYQSEHVARVHAQREPVGVDS